MATLNIQGQKVKVDDAFLSMTPEQQNAAVEEIAKSLPAASTLSGDAVDAEARAKAGIAKAQAIMASGGPKAKGGHDAPAFVPNPDMGAGGTFLTSTGKASRSLGRTSTRA